MAKGMYQLYSLAHPITVLSDEGNLVTGDLIADYTLIGERSSTPAVVTFKDCCIGNKDLAVQDFEQVYDITIWYSNVLSRQSQEYEY